MGEPIQKPIESNSTVLDTAQDFVEAAFSVALGGITLSAAKKLNRVVKKAAEAAVAPRSDHYRDFIRDLRQGLKNVDDSSSLLFGPIARFVPSRRGCEEFDPIYFLKHQLLNPSIILGTVATGGYTDEFINRCLGKPDPLDGLKILFLGLTPLLTNPFTAGPATLILTEILKHREEIQGQMKDIGNEILEGMMDAATFGAFSMVRDSLPPEEKKIMDRATDAAWTAISPALSFFL